MVYISSDGSQRFGPSRWQLPVALGLLLVAVSPAAAFNLHSRWSRTAHSGPGLQVGDPTIITWGIVADGTTIVGQEGNSPSTLIATLDALYPGGGTGNDLTNREWFPYFQQAADRWSQLAGVTYLYEPQNSSDPIDDTPGPQGAIGLVPDVRIGGHSIDGTDVGNTLAYSYYPNHSDIVLDTDNTAWLGNPADDSRRLRNLLMHEMGHGMGIDHVDMPQLALLDDVVPSQIDGPQLDDILAVQRLYGDPLEKGAGNNTHSLATPLGMVTTAAPLRIGTHGDTLAVALTDTDFISIDGTTDTDYFSFTLPVPGVVSLSLTPRGATYNIGGSSFNTKLLNDLSLTLFDPTGASEIAAANLGGAGQGELLAGVYLAEAGTYFARVTGAIDQVQLYGLDIAADALFVPGDVNLDGQITEADIATFIAGWKTVLPTDDPLAAWQKGDLDLNGVSDLFDAFRLRSALAAAGLHFDVSALVAVPEPMTGAVALGLVAIGYQFRRRTR